VSGLESAQQGSQENSTGWLDPWCASWAQHGFRAVPVNDDARLSELGHLSSLPAWYSAHMQHYQAVVASTDDVLYQPLLTEMQFDGRPMALCAGLLAAPEKRQRLRSHTADILIPLVDPTESVRIQHRFFCAFADAMNRLVMAGETDAATASLIQYATPDSAKQGLAAFSLQMLQAGAKLSVCAESYVDLTLPERQATACVRKGFRDMIRKGREQWAVQIWSDAQYPGAAFDAAFCAFQALHLQAAGRMTRPQKSWDLQKQAVAHGQSLLVTLTPIEAGSVPLDEVVGAALFDLSPTEALYSVGAYRRDLFDRPLGHVIQAAVIDELRKRGLGGYRLGARPFAGLEPDISEKEKSIGWFKAGFATHTLLNHRFTLTKAQWAAAAENPVVRKVSASVA
jgi:FemAB family protein